MTSLNTELPRSLSKEQLSPEETGAAEKTPEHKEELNIDGGDISSQRKGKRGSKGRVFKCTGYPDCNMSFTRSEHLARHKRKHTGERPFTCPHCSKNFSRLDNLRQHKQAVHPYETFPMNQMNRPDQDMVLLVNPKTPNNAYFNNQSIGNSLISPPNSQHSHYQFPYPLPTSSAQHPGSAYHSNITSNASSQPQPQPQPPPTLDIKESDYKPKRRPRPLSLSHSFLNDNNSPNRAFHKLNDDVLKSAPPLHYGQSAWPASSSSSSMQNTLISYPPPNSAPLTPNGVSPISPLYRHNFMHVNHGEPYYRGSNHRGVHSAVYQSMSSVNSPLPPVRNLPIPTNFNPVSREGKLSQSATSNSSTNSFTEIMNNKDLSNTNINNSNTENRKSWLDGVLNDDLKTNDNDNKQKVASENSGQNKEPKTHLVVSSNKPTIDSLLSPCDGEKFPDSVK